MSPPPGPPKESHLQINSFDELIKHQKEILDRISSFPNGGNLFMIHPFLLLADVGVDLSEAAKEEILTDNPQINGLSHLPYAALKRSTSKQNVRFHLKGLFQRSLK